MPQSMGSRSGGHNWVNSNSRGSSPPRDRTYVSRIGRQTLYHCATSLTIALKYILNAQFNIFYRNLQVNSRKTHRLAWLFQLPSLIQQYFSVYYCDKSFLSFFFLNNNLKIIFWFASSYEIVNFLFEKILVSCYGSLILAQSATHLLERWALLEKTSVQNSAWFLYVFKKHRDICIDI